MRVREADPRKASVRADWENGDPMSVLCAKYDLSKDTIKSWQRRDGQRGDPWKKHGGKKKRGAKKPGGKVVDLTPKRERLLRALPAAKTKTEAARKAGYAEKSARNAVRRAMQNDEFRSALEQTQAELMDSMGLSPDNLLARQAELLDRCMGGRELLDKRGRPVEVPIAVPTTDGGEQEITARVWVFDSKGANTALHKLFELRGMTRDAKEGEKPKDFIPLEDQEEEAN
jgi:hypothetical protein